MHLPNLKEFTQRLFAEPSGGNYRLGKKNIVKNYFGNNASIVKLKETWDCIYSARNTRSGGSYYVVKVG